MSFDICHPPWVNKNFVFCGTTMMFVRGRPPEGGPGADGGGTGRGATQTTLDTVGAGATQNGSGKWGRRPACGVAPVSNS